MSAVKPRPSCLGFNVLTYRGINKMAYIWHTALNAFLGVMMKGYGSLIQVNWILEGPSDNKTALV